MERVTHHFDAIRDILTGLQDPNLHGDDLEVLITYVFGLLGLLDAVIVHTLYLHSQIPRQPRAGSGCPAYSLNLQGAFLP